ncbi:MAG TPA: hypothetical protein VFH54_11475 [Mycobacteriales bacterium]|nr:hypothetical protein [Mycobacteriales bacterium]
MPVSLEARREAVADVFRALAREPVPARPAAVAAPTPEPAPAGPVVGAVVDAVESRLGALSAKISEVLARLDSVETTLLEAAWERPTVVHQPVDAEVDHVEDDADDIDDEERVSVPKVPLGEGKMSSVAARALFGG